MQTIVFEAHEARLAALGYAQVCGVDEAGRGPLAGDVYAATVVLPPVWDLPGLNDSKKLGAAQREALFAQICGQAVACCVALATLEEIAALNILGATLLAMRRAVQGLAAPGAEVALPEGVVWLRRTVGAPCLPDYVLIDGNRAPQLAMPTECLIKGDARCASVAAASVLAKVLRDRAMCALDACFPGYGFAQHKGYGTPAHYAALARLGPCPAHRLGFRLG